MSRVESLGLGSEPTCGRVLRVSGLSLLGSGFRV